jgi:hypothetical protein
MADISRLPSTSLVPQARTPARSDAVRSAQRAFFQAAVSGASAVQAQTPVTPVREVRPTTTDPSARPSANLRPGSLLDIKV